MAGTSGKSQRITVAVVKALQPGDVVQDSELKGFGVRRQQDVASYFVRKRVKGQLRRITIGRHGSPWTPETARKQAALFLQDIRCLREHRAQAAQAAL
jgi:hypothetical protein